MCPAANCWAVTMSRNLLLYPSRGLIINQGTELFNYFGDWNHWQPPWIPLIQSQAVFLYREKLSWTNHSNKTPLADLQTWLVQQNVNSCDLNCSVVLCCREKAFVHSCLMLESDLFNGCIQINSTCIFKQPMLSWKKRHEVLACEWWMVWTYI